MKRWEYKTVRIYNKSIMKRVQVILNNKGWQISSVKLRDDVIIATFRKEEQNAYNSSMC